MLDNIIFILGSAYVQVAILFLLLAYFFGHRKDPHHVVSGLTMARTLVLLLIFLYLVWNWSSEIPPSLRNSSVLGMFIINLYILFLVILSRVERPYRDALAAFAREPEKLELLRQIWQTGRRFYYYRYFGRALLSGSAPGPFIHGMAVQLVREDVKNALHQQGVERQMISFQSLTAFLKTRLAAETELPQDFKGLMDKIIGQFDQHPWIEDQVNQFLTLAMETPEELIFPKGERFWEKGG